MGSSAFFFAEVWRGFTRNVTMQVTTVGTVAVTIIMLGAFLFARTTIASFGADNASKIVISAFLRDGLSPQREKAIVASIARDPRVRSTTFVPRREGLRELRARLNGQIDASLLTSNPLPDAVRISAKNPDDVPAIARTVSRTNGVATVSYAQSVVERLLKLSDVLQRIGIGIVAILVFTTAIIISNTIRLTVFARRREIAIMQLVGASGTYVRLPFILEGLLAGLLGAILAVAALGVAQVELLPKFNAAIEFLTVRPDPRADLVLAGQMLATGAAVGIVASWLSVSRYLRA